MSAKDTSAKMRARLSRISVLPEAVTQDAQKVQLIQNRTGQQIARMSVLDSIARQRYVLSQAQLGIFSIKNITVT